MEDLLGIKNINSHSELDSESINLMDNKELALIDSGSESGMTGGRGKCVTPPEFLSSQRSLRNSALPIQGGRKFAKAGFTLAEVLITLGIIGVVAAMTIPNLMTKIQWLQLHAQFKHAYSVLSNAVQLITQNEEYTSECYYVYNTLSTSSVSGCRTFYDNLANTIKVMQICKGNAYSNGCIIDYNGLDKVLDGLDNMTQDEKELTKAGCGGFSTARIANNNWAYVLMDGITIVTYSEANMPLFLVDINGRKKPNKWGYDLFVFGLQESASGSIYLKPSGCFMIEKGGKTAQQMLTRNK